MARLTIMLLSTVTLAAASLDVAKDAQPPPALTTMPSPVPTPFDPVLELRKRQADVSYLTQVSWSSFIGQFPWPDPSTGPSWETASCENNDYYAARGGYAACCNPPAGNCRFPRGCVNGGSGVVLEDGSVGTW